MKKNISLVLAAMAVAIGISACGSSAATAPKASTQESVEMIKETPIAVAPPVPAGNQQVTPAKKGGEVGPGVTVPEYTYYGSDLVTAGVCRELVSYAKEMYDTEGLVSVPAPLLFLVDDSNKDDIKVWGAFYVFNYKPDGTTLVCESGGRDDGCMHFKAVDGGLELTDWERTTDGAGYDKSLEKICAGHDGLTKKFSTTEEQVKEARVAFLKEWIDAKGLKFDGYQDYGWPKVMLK